MSDLPARRDLPGPQHDDYSPAEPRPFGVALIAVLNFVAACLLLVAACVLMSSDGQTGGAAGGALLLIALQIALGVVVGIGLWRLKAWARWLAVVLYGLSAAMSLCSNLSNPLTLGSLLGIAIPVAAAIYLSLPRVGEAFID